MPASSITSRVVPIYHGRSKGALQGVPEEILQFLRKQLSSLDPSQTAILMTVTSFNVENLVNPDPATANYQHIVNLKRINDIQDINEFFVTVHSRVAHGGTFIGCVETSQQRKKRLLAKFPIGFNYIYYFFDFIFKRIFPKIIGLKQLYFITTAGRNRVLSKAEALGRLSYAGFKIKELEQVNNLLYFVAQRNGQPDLSMKPSYGPLFRMKRTGQYGKPLYVYKIRTMHAYSEFIQDYIYNKYRLKEGGKLAKDFRITALGRILRRYFLDELPMLLNWLKGDLKLVGIRPISQHYLSLYPEEFQAIRSQFKPGLIPPYYVDLPKTFEEIVDSEKRYLEAYATKPFRTDLKYFFNAFANILFRKGRSS